ncbi:class I SAM-dependent methyltransferase [Clostridium manihotivorum]|uniref:Class I SAM-dependent methyltransferase n=1 Tax=Clostridium manihotivorum TaxID=2320868 RepID=A0A410DTB8_9CLOT|nr:class I SAM-dependent methyltransferase [Clostridium manihotivorum]QAA32248.1 class I SAM-dependent methyltransferase [Clostridium manihotivorum]
MSIIEGLETTFNDVYAEYDKWRPIYVAELYEDIMQYKQINSSSKVLEVGIGTGQATLPILDKGCSLTAIELGDKLAEYTKQKFSKYRNFNIKNIAFQDYQCPPNSYDMIYSASAFHWIPEEIGYTKVYEMLKSGGIFARFANHPYKDKGKEAMHIAMQEVYSEYMPAVPPSPEYSEKQCKERADISKKYGFIDVKYKLYHRTRTFTSQEYIHLLGTYSDHIAIEETKRKEFFSKIKNAIDNYGGEITLYDTIDLQLARKP